MSKKVKKMTRQQQKALHKYFTLLSDELNTLGLDMKHVLREDIDIWWTPEMVKEYLFKKIMRAKLMKQSTTELSTKEVDIVFENLAFHLGGKFGIGIDFPSIETLIKNNREL